MSCRRVGAIYNVIMHYNNKHNPALYEEQILSNGGQLLLTPVYRLRIDRWMQLPHKPEIPAA